MSEQTGAGQGGQGPLTIITTHSNPDYDAVASMVAAGKLYPDAVLVFPGGHQEKNLRNFFVESLFYFINTAKIKDLDLSRVTRLVVVDTRQPGRIGPVAQVLKNPGLDIHLYDHHPDTFEDLQGSVEVVNEVGATSTILTEILVEKGIRLNTQEATMLSLGIYEDTGSFSFRSTTTRDYLAAAALLERGADLTTISELTVRELTAQQLSLLNDLISAAETRQVRGLTLVITTARSEEYVDDVAVLAHKMMDIMGLSLLFVLVEMENRVQLVIRSRMGTINAAEVAREFGGGGHTAAAAANIKDMGLNEAKMKLENILVDNLGRFYQARTVMAYPPITISENESLAAAKDLMVKYSINVLLVENDEKKVVGFISEHSVSKALYHKLPKHPVSSFMNTEFVSVGPEAGFVELKNILVDRKQRILPVLENGRALGVITRTDLLQVMSKEIEPEPAAAPQKNSPGQRNLTSQMKERLPQDIFKLLRQIGKVADSEGINVYVVGGFVRDLILRRHNLDIDISVDGDINRFITAARAALEVAKVKIHPRFKTASLKLADGYKIDLSTTRREYYEHPGALPVVQYGSIKFDLYRRDFTINSLAISLNSPDFGQLFDFYHGFQDIKDSYIRVLHNLSFVEDPTRAFRAIRFEKRLGFKLTRMTASLLENAVKHKFFNKMDTRRILAEFKIILEEEDPAPAVERLGEFGLLDMVHPKISVSPTTARLLRRVNSVKDWMRLTFAEEYEQVWLVYLLAVTESLSPEEFAALIMEFSFKKKEKDQLITERSLIGHRFNLIKKMQKNNNIKPSAFYDLFHGLSLPAVLLIMAKTENDLISRGGAAYLTSYRHTHPILTGADLIKLGLKPGPEILAALKKLKAAKLDGLVDNRQDEESLIEALAGGGNTKPAANV